MSYSLIEKSHGLSEYYTTKSLKEDLKHRDVAWQQKFAVTHDIKENHVRLQEKVEMDFREAHGRIDACFRDLVPRAEVEKRMGILVKEVQNTLDKLFDSQTAHKSLIDRVVRLENTSFETYATKLELENSEKRSAEGRRKNRVDMLEEIERVRHDSAPLVDVNARFDAAAARSGDLEETTRSLRRDLARTDNTIEDLRHSTEDRMAKKLGLKELGATLVLEIQRRDDKHAAELAEVVSSHASRAHVEDKVSVCQSALEIMRDSLTQVTKDLEKRKTHIAELDTLCKNTLATQDSVKVLEDRVYGHNELHCSLHDQEEKNMKTSTANFEKIDRITHAVQVNRSDINQLAELNVAFKEFRHDFALHKQHFASFEETLDNRERDHFLETRDDLLTTKRSIEQVDTNLRRLAGECKSAADKQEAQAEVLKQQTAMRYMEAMDKALGLSDTVQELKETNDNNTLMVDLRSGNEEGAEAGARNVESIKS